MTDPEWREFEKLVARIETALAGQQVDIRSPDHIPDVVSGNKRRQVDASLRLTVGNTPVLIIIECRKRNPSEREDVRWIEQLVTKQRDLLAAKLIAVSSREFSEFAIRKARHYNIELRTISEVSEPDVQCWCRVTEIPVITDQPSLAGVRLILDAPEGGQGLTLDREVAERFQRDSLQAPIVFRSADDQPINVQDLINAWMRKGGQIGQDVPLDETQYRKTIDLNFPSKDLYTLAGEKRIAVKVIRIAADVRRNVVFHPASQIVQSSDVTRPDETSPPVQVVEFRLDLPGGQHILSLTRDVARETVGIQLTPGQNE